MNHIVINKKTPSTFTEGLKIDNTSAFGGIIIEKHLISVNNNHLSRYNMLRLISVAIL